MNGCVVPFGIEAEAGETAIDTRAGGNTVREAVPMMVPEAAVIVGVPTDIAVARPPLMFAPAEAVHVADAVKSCVLLSV